MTSKVDPALWARFQKHKEAYGSLRGFTLAPDPTPTLDFKEARRFWYGTRADVRVARWTTAGFRYVAVFGPDDHDGGELDCLGKFTDEGAYPETLPRSNPGRHAFTRFRPGYGIAERRRDLSALGWARGAAHEAAVRQVYQDLRRAEDFGEGWSWCGLQVNVYALDDEDEKTPLGEEALWRIESDAAPSYLEEVALELAHEATPDPHDACRKIGQLHLEGVAL